VAHVDASFCSNRYIAQLWIRPGLGRVNASSRILRAAFNAAASLGVRCTAPRRGRWEKLSAARRQSQRAETRSPASRTVVRERQAAIKPRRQATNSRRPMWIAMRPSLGVMIMQTERTISRFGALSVLATSRCESGPRLAKFAQACPESSHHNSAPTSRLTAVWEDRGMQLPDNASPGAGAGPLENLQTGATAVPRVAADDCPRRSLSQGLKRRQSCRQAAQPSLPPSCRDPKARQR
jgi:hypothetical protein